MKKFLFITVLMVILITGALSEQTDGGSSMAAHYREDILKIELENGNLHRDFLRHTIGEGDALANRFGVKVFRNGEPVQLSGTCNGYFIRADGETVPVTNGVINGNVAYVTLTEECYAVKGIFSLAIKIASGGETVTMRIVDGMVSRTSTDAIVDPGTMLPSIEDLIAAIENAAESVPADYSDLSMATNRAWWQFGEKDLNANLAKASGRSRVFNGLTFKAKDGKVTVTGTSTGASNYDMFSYLDDPAGFPLLPGRRYSITFSEDDTSHSIYKQILYTVPGSNDWVTVFQSTQTDGAVVFTMPDHYEKFVIRLVCDAAGITYDKTVEFNIKNVVQDQLRPFDESIMEAAKNGSFSYNMFFERAGSISRNYYGLTIADYGEKLEISGTATATTTYMLIEDRNNTIFKPKDKILVQFANAERKVYLEVVTKKGSTTHTPMLQTQAPGTFLLEFPDDFDYCRINLLFINGTEYSSTVKVNIKSSNDIPRKIIVAKDGTGDYTKIKDAVEDAVATYGTTVIVKPGEYSLVEEYGESYLDGLAGGDYGMMLMNGINLIFAPNAHVSFDYDGDNTWVIENFSPFNTGNDTGFTIDGLHCQARNCRYIIHDDPRPGTKEKYSKNVYRNCFLEMFPSPTYPTWVNHQIIGGGLGDATQIIIEGCIFINHFTGVEKYSTVSYHNSTSGNLHYESMITVKDCWFADGNMLVFEGYGAATEKTKVIVTNNSLENLLEDIVYNSGSADNMTIMSWNNYQRE